MQVKKMILIFRILILTVKIHVFASSVIIMFIKIPLDV